MDDFAKDIVYAVLKSGMRVVHRLTPGPVAYVGFMMNTGSRDESLLDTGEETHGLAHFVEHTIYKGTANRNARQIIDCMEDVGGEVNAYTTKEETALYTIVLSDYVEKAVELMADMLLNATFPETELKKEREVILDEIDSYLDTPSEQIFDDFESLLFGGHPMGKPILGTKKSVRRLKGSTAKSFMMRCYNPEEIVLFAQGPMTLNQLVEWGEHYLSDIPFSARSWQRMAPQPVEPFQMRKNCRVHQTHMMMGAPAYALDDERRLGMVMLNNILGGPGLNSMLNLALREAEGLVYTVESNYQSLTDCGYWSIYFGCDATDLLHCRELAMKCLQQLRDNRLTNTQLQRYKQQLRGQLAVGAENQENRVLAMAKSHLHFNRVRDWQQTMAQFEKLTADELLCIANEAFDEKNLSTLEFY